MYRLYRTLGTLSAWRVEIGSPVDLAEHCRCRQAQVHARKANAVKKQDVKARDQACSEGSWSGGTVGQFCGCRHPTGLQAKVHARKADAVKKQDVNQPRMCALCPGLRATSTGRVPLPALRQCHIGPATGGLSAPQRGLLCPGSGLREAGLPINRQVLMQALCNKNQTDSPFLQKRRRRATGLNCHRIRLNVAKKNQRHESFVGKPYTVCF